MKRRSWVLYGVLIVSLFATGPVLGQKGGKGGGGANQDPKASFQFPIVEGVLNGSELAMPFLTGDGFPGLPTSGEFSIYEDSELYPGIGASFMGSGNPKLDLHDPDRSLYVRFEDTPGCMLEPPGRTLAVSGDAMWLANTGTTSDWRDEDFQLIDGALLGMTAGIDVAYSRIILRAIIPDENGTEFLWRIIFGDWEGATNPNPEKTRVKVTVEDWDESGNPIQWRIVGLDNSYSSASVTSVGPKIKGKSESFNYGICRTLIDFDIHRLP